MGYQKFCYWVDPKDLESLRRNFEAKGIQLAEEALIPCRVLRASRGLSLLVPKAWEGFCKRRTSWYRFSEKSDQSLVVSNDPLDLLNLGPPILIREADFKPDRLPTSEEVVTLLQSGEFQRRKPSEWDKVQPLEEEFHRRWFTRLNPNEPFDFGKIFLSHSANHANFLDPEFFIHRDGAIVPYSIGNSLHVCSSCLEFFNILGETWELKYVVPCIGAFQFAHLPVDHYLEVKRGRKRG